MLQTAGLLGIQGFFPQKLKCAVSGIHLYLLVPSLPVFFKKPSTEPAEFSLRERIDRSFKFFNIQHISLLPDIQQSPFEIYIINNIVRYRRVGKVFWDMEENTVSRGIRSYQFRGMAPLVTSWRISARFSFNSSIVPPCVMYSGYSFSQPMK